MESQHNFLICIYDGSYTNSFDNLTKLLSLSGSRLITHKYNMLAEHVKITKHMRNLINMPKH